MMSPWIPTVVLIYLLVLLIGVLAMGAGSTNTRVSVDISCPSGSIPVKTEAQDKSETWSCLTKP